MTIDIARRMPGLVLHPDHALKGVAFAHPFVRQVAPFFTVRSKAGPR
jgi:hypothetical protein